MRAARLLPVLLLLTAAPALAQESPLPPDVAAEHPQGKWKIRTAELYRYLARYKGATPSINPALQDYVKARLVEAEARKRGIRVTEEEITEWIEKIDRLQRSEKGVGLEKLRQASQMSQRELRRRARQWLLYEKVTQAVMAEKDPTRRAGQLVSEGFVRMTVDTLFEDADKELDRRKLPDNVVFRVNGLEVTEYEWGRVLSIELAPNEVGRALADLILAKEVELLTGNDDPPTKEEMAYQERWQLEWEKNRIKRQVRDPSKVTDEWIKAHMANRGITMESLRRNPAFRANARARGYFMEQLDDAALKQFFEENQERYAPLLEVQRILVAARAQRVPGIGQRVKTLPEGKAEIQGIHARLVAGADFATLARRKSDDPKVIKLNGGVIPYELSKATPGYKDTYLQAAELDVGEITRPFYSAGRGYVIAKLLDRKPSRTLEKDREEIARDAANQMQRKWQIRVIRAAHKNRDLFQRE